MAEQTILNVSLKEYKKNIDDLRASLLELDKDSQEYKDTVKVISDMQSKLNDALNAGKREIDGAEGSYNHLVQTLTNLKKQWKATSDEAERNRIGGQMKEVNDKLKNLDASVGNYQRNVGNYASAWQDALKDAGSAVGGLGGKMAGAIGGVQGITAAFKGLWAALGPIGIVIMVIVGALKLLSNGITSSETNTRKLQKILVPFKAILDLIDQALQATAGFLLDCADKMMSFAVSIAEWYDALPDWGKVIINPMSLVAEKVGDATGVTQKYKEALEAENKILQLNNKLTDDKRQIVQENAKLEKQEMEYMEQYTNTANTLNNRIDALNKAQEARIQIAKNNTQIAKEELALLEEQSKTSDNDAEMNDKLAEAIAKVTKAEAEQTRVLVANNKERKEAQELYKKLFTENLTSEVKASQGVYELLLKSDKKWLETKKDTLRKQLDLTLANMDNELQQLKEKLKNATGEEAKTINDTIANYEQQKKNARIKAYDEFIQAEIEHYTAYKELEIQNAEKLLSDYAKLYGENSKQYAQQEIVVGKLKFDVQGDIQNILTTIRKSINDSDDEIVSMRQKMVDKYLELTQKQYNDAFDIYQKSQKKLTVKEISDIEKYYDTQTEITESSLEKARLQNQKYVTLIEGVNDAVQPLLDGMMPDWDNLHFDPQTQSFAEYVQNLKFIDDETGKVTEEYTKFMQFLDLVGLKLEGEDLTDFQLRLKQWTDGLKQSDNQILQTETDLLKLDQANKHLSETFSSNVWQSTIFADLKNDVKLAQIELDNLHKEKGETESDYYARQLEAQKNYNQATVKLEKERIKSIGDASNAVGSIFQSVASMMQANIEKELEAGEISEEEAQKQFKRVKALQYAQTWINTLSSVMQIMSDSSISSYWVKAPLAAAQLAAGIATTQQISQTEIGSVSTDSSNVTPQIGLSSANVTPLLDQTRDLNNMSQINYSQQDTRVYVVESDISEMGQRVQVKEQSTTF